METIFCPKCHKEVCQIRRSGDNTEIVQNGKILLLLKDTNFLDNNSISLRCPDGHNVPVGHAKTPKGEDIPEWARELMVDASKRLAEVEQLVEELERKPSSSVGTADPPDPTADPVNFIATETPDPSNYIGSRYLSLRAATFTITREEDAAGNFIAYVVSDRYGVPVYTWTNENEANVAIQWAIDNIGDEGGIIQLGSGNFNCLATIDLSDARGIWLRGSGRRWEKREDGVQELPTTGPTILRIVSGASIRYGLIKCY
jgi:hypothetical protein